MLQDKYPIWYADFFGAESDPRRAFLIRYPASRAAEYVGAEGINDRMAQPLLSEVAAEFGKECVAEWLASLVINYARFAGNDKMLTDQAMTIARVMMSGSNMRVREYMQFFACLYAGKLGEINAYNGGHYTRALTKYKTDFRGVDIQRIEGRESVERTSGRAGVGIDALVAYYEERMAQGGFQSQAFVEKFIAGNAELQAALQVKRDADPNYQF